MTLGRPKELTAIVAEVRQKLLPLLMDYARARVRKVAAINGAAQPRVFSVDVVASALGSVGCARRL